MLAYEEPKTFIMLPKQYPPMPPIVNLLVRS